MVVFHVFQIVQKAPNYAKHHILRLGGKSLYQFKASVLYKVATPIPPSAPLTISPLRQNCNPPSPNLMSQLFIEYIYQQNNKPEYIS